MLFSKLRGRVKGKTIELDESVPLADNTEVELSMRPVMSIEEQRAAILAFADSEPKISREDMDELMRIIDEGKRLSSPVDVFDERPNHSAKH